MDIGGRIAELRKERGLTQQELADRLYVSRQLVSKWESGDRRPDYKTVVKIAQTLDAKPEDIVREEDVIIEELAACVPDEGRNGNNGNAGTHGIDLPALLNGFLKTLPEAACDIFIRRYRAHETPEEIGARYGVGDNYVRSILARTRKKLKKYLKEKQNG